MNNNTWEGLDELVRDITKVGSISKSETRRRIVDFVSKQIPGAEKRVIDIVGSKVRSYTNPDNNKEKDAYEAGRIDVINEILMDLGNQASSDMPEIYHNACRHHDDNGNCCNPSCYCHKAISDERSEESLAQDN